MDNLKNIFVISIAFLLFSDILFCMSVTYQPKKKKRARTHGFLKRMQSPTGRAVLSRRRAKGRKKLTVRKSK